MKKAEPTKQIESCILRIRAIQGSLKSAERRVADYILANPQDVLNSTIQELAEKTSTSYATITRLVSKLGFSGFKEMRRTLYHDTLNNHMLDTLDVMTFSQGSTTREICKNMNALTREILDNCYDMLDITTLDALAERIIYCGCLCIIGTGLSNVSARYAYSHFIRIGIHCFHDSDATHSKMQASLLTQDDVLMAISSSGRSVSVLDCAKIARQNGVTIAALSDYAITPLSDLADYQLYTTPRNVSQFMDIDMPLLQGQFYLLDVLFMCCCVKLGEVSSRLYTKTKVATDSEKLQ